MGNENKYLDYEGLMHYHKELVNRLKDLEYDPKRIFASQSDLMKKDNWDIDQYGRIFGLKTGLVVTVDKHFWQLTEPSKFAKVFKTIGDKSGYTTPESIGWEVVGSTVDFEIDDHTLKLLK